MKGFTFIEKAVVLVICLTFGVVFFTISAVITGGDVDCTYIAPQTETARQQRNIAAELKRQNDLTQEQLKQQKK